MNKYYDSKKIYTVRVSKEQDVPLVTKEVIYQDFKSLLVNLPLCQKPYDTGTRHLFLRGSSTVVY